MSHIRTTLRTNGVTTTFPGTRPRSWGPVKQWNLRLQPPDPGPTRHRGHHAHHSLGEQTSTAAGFPLPHARSLLRGHAMGSGHPLNHRLITDHGRYTAAPCRFAATVGSGGSCRPRASTRSSPPSPDRPRAPTACPQTPSRTALIRPARRHHRLHSPPAANGPRGRARAAWSPPWSAGRPTPAPIEVGVQVPIVVDEHCVDQRPGGSDDLELRGSEPCLVDGDG
jgi:hypothetical protein